MCSLIELSKAKRVNFDCWSDLRKCYIARETSASKRNSSTAAVAR
jgi:hypothetical protein